MQLRFLSILWLLTLSAAAGVSVPVDVKHNPSDSTDAWKREMLDRVNRLRAKGCHCGRKYMSPAPPLSWNDRLEAAALSHAKDMQRNNFIGHRGTSGTSIGDRVDRTGYNWQSVGENIAWNVQSLKAVISGWKESPGHCISMMNPSYSEMGAARYEQFWVQIFGSPRK